MWVNGLVVNETDDQLTLRTEEGVEILVRKSDFCENVDDLADSQQCVERVLAYRKSIGEYVTRLGSYGCVFAVEGDWVNIDQLNIRNNVVLCGNACIQTLLVPIIASRVSDRLLLDRTLFYLGVIKSVVGDSFEFRMRCSRNWVAIEAHSYRQMCSPTELPANSFINPSTYADLCEIFAFLNTNDSSSLGADLRILFEYKRVQEGGRFVHVPINTLAEKQVVIATLKSEIVRRLIDWLVAQIGVAQVDSTALCVSVVGGDCVARWVNRECEFYETELGIDNLPSCQVTQYVREDLSALLLEDISTCLAGSSNDFLAGLFRLAPVGHRRRQRMQAPGRIHAPIGEFGPYPLFLFAVEDSAPQVRHFANFVNRIKPYTFRYALGDFPTMIPGETFFGKRSVFITKNGQKIWENLQKNCAIELIFARVLTRRCQRVLSVRSSASVPPLPEFSNPIFSLFLEITQKKNSINFPELAENSLNQKIAHLQGKIDHLSTQLGIEKQARHLNNTILAEKDLLIRELSDHCVRVVHDDFEANTVGERETENLQLRLKIDQLLVSLQFYKNLAPKHSSREIQKRDELIEIMNLVIQTSKEPRLCKKIAALTNEIYPHTRPSSAPSTAAATPVHSPKNAPECV